MRVEKNQRIEGNRVLREIICGAKAANKSRPEILKIVDFGALINFNWEFPSQFWAKKQHKGTPLQKAFCAFLIGKNV